MLQLLLSEIRHDDYSWKSEEINTKIIFLYTHTVMMQGLTSR